MASSYTVNGPRAGRGTGRQRKTLLNNQSKQGVPPPQLQPSQVASIAGARAGNQLNLASTLANLRAQAGQVRNQFGQAKAAANVTRIENQVAAVNAGLESGGGFGGSFALEQRAKADTQRQSEIQTALQNRVSGLLGLKRERIGAMNQYYTTEFDLAAQKAAMQQEAANRAFMEDLVMRMNDETVPGQDNSLGGGFKDIRKLLQQLSGGGLLNTPMPAAVGTGGQRTLADVLPRLLREGL